MVEVGWVGWEIVGWSRYSPEEHLVLGENLSLAQPCGACDERPIKTAQAKGSIFGEPLKIERIQAKNSRY